MIIAVIGSAKSSTELLDNAEQVGLEIGKRGIHLVCGGGKGVMEAACRGSKAGGGLTIGILSSGDSKSANPWVDISIPTGFSQGRNVIIAKTGDAVIAIGGRYGTLSEIGHALKAGKPVIGLNTWKFENQSGPDLSIIESTDPIDAVDKAVEVIQTNQRAQNPES